MVYAELIHNPYLLQTFVKFNGHEPRINSQIEKYEKQTLKDWVHKVPEIFYDEMNGYDFDLNFTGTKPDFEEVKRAFANAGISQEEVRLFFKNELEDAETKSTETEQLICWLNENQNRKFSFDEFYEENRDLFEGSYPCIVIGDRLTEVTLSGIEIESVDSVEEIRGTLLTNTPVLLCINDNTLRSFRNDLTELLERKDVMKNQIFFIIHPGLNEEQMIRTIIDLGIETPQVIDSYDDKAIMTYMRNYPITEYIRETIKVFERVVGDISLVLDEENEKSIITNAGIHAEIDRLEASISRLKSTNDFFVERDNVNTPLAFENMRVNLREKILSWKNRKTKVTGDAESEAMAKEYDSELSGYMSAFVDGIQSEYSAICMRVFHNFKEKYAEQGLDRGFSPNNVSAEKLLNIDCPSLEVDFISMKEITFVEPRNDIFNMFLKSSAKEDKTPVRVVTCYFEHWRNKAVEVIDPIAERYIRNATESLHTYYDALAEAFHIYLEELIVQQTTEKEKVSAQLSDDERKLQEDNDWLAEFKDKLFHIERG